MKDANFCDVKQNILLNINIDNISHGCYMFLNYKSENIITEAFAYTH